MDAPIKTLREVIVKAGRFRHEHVYAPFDCFHPLDIHAEVEALRDPDISARPLEIYTRNPYVLDEFPAEQCFIVGPSGKEKRLLDHPDADRFLGSLSTGEFWSHVGEAWVDSEES
jgi:hypothetical protein